jgi:hypothetical protein
MEAVPGIPGMVETIINNDYVGTDKREPATCESETGFLDRHVLFFRTNCLYSMLHDTKVQ